MIMKCVVFAFTLLCFLPASFGDSHMRTVLAVTRCRASCLDQHAHLIRTEDTCQKDSHCLMCWETCKMVHENFKIWGSMCSVPDICFPGCQTACKSLSKIDLLNETALSSLTIKSVYDLSTSRVMLEWIPNDFSDIKGTVLYTVLFRDRTQDWHQIAQTISHVVHVKGNLVNRGTSIRMLAANATHQISYSETTYVNSLVLGSKKEVYSDENSWTPQLISLERDNTSAGILATITWPKIPNEFGLNEYEVSWNVLDNTMITGHLLTTKNIAIITLWPESVHLVMVDRYTSAGLLYGDSSQALIIDTKEPFVPILLKSTTLCNNDKEVEMKTVIYYCIISILLFVIIILYAYIKLKGQVKSYRDKYCNQISLLYEKINVLHPLQQEQKSKALLTPAHTKNEEAKCDAKIPRINSEICDVV